MLVDFHGHIRPGKRCCVVNVCQGQGNRTPVRFLVGCENRSPSHSAVAFEYFYSIFPNVTCSASFLMAESASIESDIKAIETVLNDRTLSVTTQPILQKGKL